MVPRRRFGFWFEQEHSVAKHLLYGMGGGWGWRRGWGGGMGDSTTTVENTPVGTLVVDVVRWIY